MKQGSDYPGFMLKKFMHKFKHLEHQHPTLNIKYEPYADMYHEEKALLALIDSVRNEEARIPQILMIT